MIKLARLDTDLIAEYQYEDVFFTIDDSGKEYCDEETAIALMLLDQTLFLNEGICPYTLSNGVNPKSSILYVNCNDTFAYCSSDAEPIPYSQIGELFKLWHQNHTLGPIKWVSLQRQQLPVFEYIKDLKESGMWDESLERLAA